MAFEAEMLLPLLLPLFTHNPDKPQRCHQKNQQHDPLRIGQLPFPQPDAAHFVRQPYSYCTGNGNLRQST